VAADEISRRALAHGSLGRLSVVSYLSIGRLGRVAAIQEDIERDLEEGRSLQLPHVWYAQNFQLMG